MNLIEDLMEAAAAVAVATQQVIGENKGIDKSRVEVKIPIIAPGLRVTVEAGPGITAANAIETASAKAGVKPKMRFEDAARRAAELLAQEAATIKECNTIPGQSDWSKDSDAEKNAHDEMMEIAAALLQGGAK